MKRTILGLTVGLIMALGSSMCVCAEEAAPEAAQEQNVQPQEQQYQPIMTPEILASFEMDINDMDEMVLSNALVRRTDSWGELQDADGDGIDDRDPINGCGYLDLNYNGFDDRFEASAVRSLANEDPVDGYAMQIMFNMLTHRCKHGIIYSEFLLDESLCTYWSIPAYFDKCEECSEAFDNMTELLSELNW